MDIQDILEYLPHRYPFLLVDRVLVWLGWLLLPWTRVWPGGAA